MPPPYAIDATGNFVYRREDLFPEWVRPDEAAEATVGEIVGGGLLGGVVGTGAGVLVEKGAEALGASHTTAEVSGGVAAVLTGGGIGLAIGGPIGGAVGAGVALLGYWLFK